MKKYILTQIFLIIFTLILIGQTSLLERTSKIQLGDFITTNVNAIGLKEIVENIEYVKLESKPECVLGRIQWLVGSRDFFFVGDINGISQFKRTGEFVRKIGQIGRGPGEYPGLIDLAADESEQRLYVLANYVRKVFVYDFAGKFLNSIQLDDIERVQIDITQNGYLVLQTGQLNKSSLLTEILDKQGSSILKFNSRIKYNPKDIILSKGQSITYQYDNNLYLKMDDNDTIYKITSKKIVPKYVFDLGKYKPPILIPNKEQGKYVQICGIRESDEYMLIFFLFNNTICTASYNKSKQKISVSIPEDEMHIGVKNDFDNGINFLATNIPWGLRTTEMEWIQPLEPNSFIKLKDNKKILGNLKTCVNQYSIDDNPVIMILKYK